MKKLFLLSIIALFSFSYSNAQGVDFGVKAGVNLATVTGDDTNGVKSRTSFHVGGVAEIMVSDVFSVQPELLYSSQGYSFSDGFDIDIMLDYINIPVMAKYYIANNLSLEAGPQIGFLVSAKGKAQGETEDVKDFVKGLDFGFNLGAAYKLENGLNFGLRYNLGLANINDAEDFEDSEGFKNQNSVFQISVGFMF